MNGEDLTLSLLVQLQSTLLEPLGSDAATLELEQEAKAGSQQVVEVLDGQRDERVGIEGRGGSAPHSRHEPLLEEALACLIQDARLAGRADQIGELIEQPRAGAV